ncbi:hypothetical protein [Thermosulfuriphilus sp.]
MSEKSIFIYRQPKESQEEIENPKILAQRLIQAVNPLIETHAVELTDEDQLRLTLGIILGLAYFVERWQRLIGFGKRSHSSWQAAFLRGLSEEVAYLWKGSKEIREYISTYIESNFKLLSRELDAYPLPLEGRTQALLHLAKLLFEEDPDRQEAFVVQAQQILKVFFNPP